VSFWKSSASESHRFRAGTKREVKIFLSTSHINSVLRLNVDLVALRI